MPIAFVVAAVAALVSDKRDKTIEEATGDAGALLATATGTAGSRRAETRFQAGWEMGC